MYISLTVQHTNLSLQCSALGCFGSECTEIYFDACEWEERKELKSQKQQCDGLGWFWLQTLLVGDTVKGWVVAAQGLWNCPHTCTHLCLKDLVLVLMFLLLPTSKRRNTHQCTLVWSWFWAQLRIQTPAWAYLPTTVVVTSVSTLQIGKI